VGLRTALRLTRTLDTSSGQPVAPAIHSPWSDTDQLSTIVWSDLLDLDLLPLTRAEAMAVPAMARARHLIVGAVATCPLVAYRGAVALPDADQPAWMYRTDGDVSPWHRMAWTVDDLVFSGWSLWAVDRGADGSVLAADRVPFDAWSFGDDGRTILVGDQPVARRDVVLIPGPHEGVLSFAARSLRAASKLERSAARHAQNPVPSVELRQTQDVQLTTAERDELVAGWVAARASESGAVGFTSYGVEAHALGQVPEQLLVEGRNAAAVDVARHVSMPAAMLDATTAGASLTYETTQGRSGQFLDYGVRLYLDAIAGRLSMDDVVPRGTRTVLDTTGLTALVPTEPNTLD
jgi:hypothetical protein